jgi:hypothetical protein
MSINNYESDKIFSGKDITSFPKDKHTDSKNSTSAPN